MGILCTLINLYLLVIFGFIILSWFPLAPGGIAFRIYGYLRMAVDPCWRRCGGVLPRLGPLDISPIILILGIGVIERLIGCSGGFI